MAEALTARIGSHVVAGLPGLQGVRHRDLSPDLNGNGEIEPEEWVKSCPCFEVKAEFGSPEKDIII